MGTKSSSRRRECTAKNGESQRLVIRRSVKVDLAAHLVHAVQLLAVLTRLKVLPSVLGRLLGLQVRLWEDRRVSLRARCLLRRSKAHLDGLVLLVELGHVGNKIL